LFLMVLLVLMGGRQAAIPFYAPVLRSFDSLVAAMPLKGQGFVVNFGH
jgi:hypothetical protein